MIVALQQRVPFADLLCPLLDWAALSGLGRSPFRHAKGAVRKLTYPLLYWAALSGREVTFESFFLLPVS